jgi:hypothetical protein
MRVHSHHWLNAGGPLLNAVMPKISGFVMVVRRCQGNNRAMIIFTKRLKVSKAFGERDTYCQQSQRHEGISKKAASGGGDDVVFRCDRCKNEMTIKGPW